MSATPPSRSYLKCESKRRYCDEFAARAAAQHILTTYAEAAQQFMWVYHCPHCHGWHPTHKKQPAANAPVSRFELYAVEEVAA